MLRYAIMAARNRSLKDELDAYNQGLDQCLRGRFGMTLKLFKTIKAATQLVGAGAGVYAMAQGADPMTSFALIALIISGPEALEYIISNSEESN